MALPPALAAAFAEHHDATRRALRLTGAVAAAPLLVAFLLGVAMLVAGLGADALVALLACGGLFAVLILPLPGAVYYVGASRPRQLERGLRSGALTVRSAHVRPRSSLLWGTESALRLMLSSGDELILRTRGATAEAAAR